MTQTVLLGDICLQITDGTHGTVKDNEGGPAYLLSAKNIKDKVVVSHNERRIDFVTLEQLRKRTKTAKGDVLVTSVGTIGETAIIDEESPNYEFQRSVLILKPNTEKVIPRYLYYAMRSLKNDFISMATGAVQKCLFIGRMKSVSIELPNLETQKKIASILGTIDEKIELNRQMNETLEQMGQALFRHYFIDNPEAVKWEEKQLGDFVELVNGASYKSAELQPSKNALVTLKSVGRGGGFSRRGYKEFTGKMKDTQIVHDGDLVVAHTDLTQKAEVAGYPALVDGADYYDQVAISMDLVKVIPRSENLSSSVVYFLLKTREFQEHKMGYISGSTVLHLNKKCIPSYMIALPSDESVLQAMSSEFDDLMEKIKNNNQQIQTLTTLRDTLLPRLIRGKLKI